MAEGNYQQQWHDPYAIQANEPGRDHGLWSILGRAIRSQVPERRNDAFDASAPVGGTNTPYQQPGFFRALVGDRGGDFNRAAMLNADAVNQGNTQAGIQQTVHGQNRAADQDASNEHAGFVQGLIGKRQELLQKNAQTHQMLRDQVLQGSKYLQDQDRNNRARELQDLRFNNAKDLIGMRANSPRPLNPTLEALHQQQTRRLQMQNDEMDPRLQPAPKPPTSLIGSIKSALGFGGGQPATNAPVAVPKGGPSVIKIDPMDLPRRSIMDAPVQSDIDDEDATDDDLMDNGGPAI